MADIPHVGINLIDRICLANFSLFRCAATGCQKKQANDDDDV